MKNSHFFLLFTLFSFTVSSHAQSGKQKKADRLFDSFAYLEATEVYKELINNDHNVERNSMRLGDAYMLLRSPENAVFYYEDIIKNPNISPEYYYKYAQALRGVKRYDESRTFLKRYLETGKNSGDIQTMINKDEYKSKATYRLELANFNSEVSDFGVFEMNGQVYFVSARAENLDIPDRTYSWNGEPFLDIYKLDTKNGNITPIEGEINTKLHDGPAVISPNGSTIYFTRNNYVDNREGKTSKDKTNHLKIYSAIRTNNTWMDVIELPFNSNEYSIGHPSLSRDGKTLFFTSDMPTGKGGTDIYKVEIKNDGTFGGVANLGDAVNTEFDETFPFLDTDGTLYFSSNGHAGLGLFDIFRFEMDSETVENLGESINSSMDDFAYFQVDNSLEGYISSNREGNNDNIYVFNKMTPLIVEGIVSDAINGDPIVAATVRIMDEDGEQLVFLETNKDGYFQTQVDRNKLYPVEAKEIKYQTFNGTLDTKKTENVDTLQYNIVLDPVKDVEYLAEINNIYFDFDKYNIRKDAAQELDKLVDLMQNKYPELVIAIGSHTDSRGTNLYNEKLAERRAKSTYNYMISRGITKDRIRDYTGYGENNPAIDCERCSTEEHQLNRRSMFKIVRM